MNQHDVTVTPYYQIVTEYFQEMGIAPFDVKIIESNDLESAFYTVRPDQAGKYKRNSDEYHGFCVPPATLDGIFSILLKKDYMENSKNSRKFEWVGTIIHEVTHADDYQKYQEIISAQSYEELFDPNVHRIFGFWTEYHARVMGTEYMMKYRKDDNSSYAEHDNVVVEFEALANWYNNSNGPGERLLECDATLLGMLRVLEKYFPATFNDGFLSDVESLQKLYCFLKDHDTIEKAAPCFGELHHLLKGVHPFMP